MQHAHRGPLASPSRSSSTVKLPSRASSPTGLRSRAQVGITSVDAHSDSLDQLQQDAAFVHQQLVALGEDAGFEREVQLPPPKEAYTAAHADEPLIDAGIADYTFLPQDQGGLLGKGKFSSVHLAWKAGQKFAVKVTPLYPHHNLIATRLLREPTILAQLPSHPNLVRVFESIRTPGHFYLVEEFLDGYINLENFVAQQPKQRLELDQATYVFEQLVSVVRSGLHQPIQIAHRDIKPENILIHPETLSIVLLDFGLATHFSEREPKLTTCCGSPAFHAPELVQSLKSPPGSVRYWGPEIDIWTIGVTILRCLTGVKYPLGVAHTSAQHLVEKAKDALEKVEDQDMRETLAGLLQIDGCERIHFFRSLPAEIDQVPYKRLESGNDPRLFEREFKNTTFIPTQPKYTLPLPLVSPKWLSPCISPSTPNGYSSPGTRSRAGSRAGSKDRLSAYFASGLAVSASEDRLAASHPASEAFSNVQPDLQELMLLNPTGEPPMRAISFIKYALRCAGILYHIQPESDDMSQDLPLLDAPTVLPESPTLHCVLILPKDQPPQGSAAAELLTQLRPGLARSQTAMPRSSSTPPTQARNTAQTKKIEPVKARILEFWMQIIPIFAAPSSPTITGHSFANGKKLTRKHRTKSRSTSILSPEEKSCVKIRIRVSDAQAIDALKQALSVGKYTTSDNYDNPSYTHTPQRTIISLPTVPGDSDQEKEELSSRGRSTASKRGQYKQGHLGSHRPRMARASTDLPPAPADDAAEQDVQTPGLTPTTTEQFKGRRGFFDFVSFGAGTRKNEVSAHTATAHHHSNNSSQPVTPSPLAFAAL